MKKILGLDLGTNSIGWALINNDFENKEGNIEGIGSRIIPMSQDVLGKFDSGVSISQTADRTQKRGARRLVQRFLLRRERLHRVLNILNFLPKHYSESIDFDKCYGQFKPNREEKLSFYKNENGKSQFIFMDSHAEMLKEFQARHPDLKKIPYDWTIYYLRNKALSEKISKEELAWILLNFNQKRGYYQLRGEEEDIKENKTEEFHSLLVTDVIEREKGKKGIWYNVILENGWIYKRESNISLSNWIGKKKDFIITTELNEDGSIKLNKENEEKRSFRSPKEDDWGLVKIRTEQTINQSGKTVGTFIYYALLNNPSQKVKGKLVKTIERKFYKDELIAIMKAQIEFHPELKNPELYTNCINELYKQNESHKSSIRSKGFDYLFIDDIIFYHRPLKSKKSQISDCSLENRVFIKNGERKTQTIKCIAKSNPLFQEFRLIQFVKNLRIYERESFINGKTLFDVDITQNFIKTETDLEDLFVWLNDKAEISQKQFLAYPKFKLKEDKYRWNYTEDKTYPCNETRNQFLNAISKINGIDNSFFDSKTTSELWHILYSVTDKIQFKNAIATFASKKIPDNSRETFIEKFSKLKPYKSEYGSFSEKAIKKLLPLIRFGSFWNEEAIDKKTQDRIQKLIDGEYDENIRTRVREKAINLAKPEDFKNLPLWLASYIVYDRHSEASDISKWKTPADINWFLNNKNPNGFKQHSLRNPIVEQVITETLRVVKDIWQQYGLGAENFFDEIHIELGREMKNPADKRKQLTNMISQNENTNLRIKAILEELKSGGINDVRPYSPSQQEILKIYEEGVYSNEKDKDRLDEADKIRKNNKPTKAEIMRYKLWLEQGYISPYTGKIIPLSSLFSSKYQIEHIIPQSRFFDDSMTNKVICESEVNELKSNSTAMEFIANNGGRIVTLSGGGTVTVFSTEQYTQHINTYYSKNKSKQKRLLSEEIPEKFIERQLNDSRYISKVVKTLLSKIVREEDEQEVTSKNIIPLNGSITSKMKQDWGLNDIWNELITPRFERLNTLTNSKKFGDWELKRNDTNDGQGKRVFQTTVPDEIAKGFNKKRIDHRHHALDALVIACVTKDHINYLNSINAERKNYSLVSKLRRLEEIQIKDETKKVPKEFHKPWDNFNKEAKDKLYTTVVSFKQNIRVINKTVNKYQTWKNENGVMKKVIVPQTKGDNWAIRKSLHTPMPYTKKTYDFDILNIIDGFGKIDAIIDPDYKAKMQDLRSKHKTIKDAVNETKKKTKVYLEVYSKYQRTINDIHLLNLEKEPNQLKIEELLLKKEKYKSELNNLSGHLIVENDFELVQHISFKTTNIKYRKRQPISELSNRGQGGIKTVADAIKFINKIADIKLRKDLLTHLKKSSNDLEQAFSTEGIDNFNSKRKIPVYRLPIAESGTGRFQVGTNAGTSHKWVEADKGTNLYFTIYRDEENNSKFISIPLNEVIQNLKDGLLPVPERYIDDKNNKEYQLTQFLSPNDLVYIPTEDEVENSTDIDLNNLTKEQVNRLYNVNDFSGYTIYFTPNHFAKNIAPKELDTSFDSKLSKSIEGVVIKENFWKLEINRLGKITKVHRSAVRPEEIALL